MEIGKVFSWHNENVRKNNPLLPSNIRAILVGKSNSGKTTVLMNLLLQKGWIDYDKLYVYGKSLHQPEYRLLKKGFEEGLSKVQISNVFQNQDVLREAHLSLSEVIEKYKRVNTRSINVEFYDDCSVIPDPASLVPNVKSILVMDDCYLGLQKKAAAYYSRGRHWNFDVLFLSQNYFRLGRQSIRENGNFFILFPQDAKNIAHIWSDHASIDMPLEEFSSFCRTVWDGGKHNFVTIDLTSEINHGKYRRNFDSFYIKEA